MLSSFVESHAIRLEAIYSRLIVSNASPPSRYTDIWVLIDSSMSDAAIWRLHRILAAEVSIMAPFAEESGYDFVLD